MDKEKDSKEKKDSVRPMAILIGISIFAVLNAVLLVSNPLRDVDPEGMPSAHTWVWWATREFLDQTKAPDVVILGPSMLMHCIARLDANHLNRNLDYVHHHRSDYMADALDESLKLGGVNCFNFALPGAMISDCYMVVHGLLKGKRKPKVLVLGMGVRDFCDCQVSTPAATPAFKYLKRFSNIDDVVHLCMPQIWRRTDYFLGKIIYLHGKKLDMQVALAEAFKQGFGPWCKKNFPPCRLDETDPTRNMPGNMKSEIEEGMYVVSPNIPYAFQDNTREYKRRYRNKNDTMFAIQAEFLERLMADCKQEGIRVILVNVPVTNLNHKLMPEGNYDRYLSLLESTADKWGALFLNIGDDRAFTVNDYYDTVHLNASGGKKLVDRIVAAITVDSQTVVALGNNEGSATAIAGVGSHH